MQAIERGAVRRRSSSRLRSVLALAARRFRWVARGSASGLFVMAARGLGPGPARLRLVKLAHSVRWNETLIELPQQPVEHPRKRAA